MVLGIYSHQSVHAWCAVRRFNVIIKGNGEWETSDE